MKVKELDKTVNLAWSPPSLNPLLVAAGTAAQQLDASFSTSASLDIYDLNLNEPGLDMELRSSVQSENRFHKLAWGACGAGGGNSGVVVGGCDGGRLQMYNAAQLLAGDDGLMCAPERHTGPVRAIDFNSFQTNLLSTGASDSEIFIWDLNNVKTPMTPGAKSQPAEEVVWLAWNKQVQHILASAFATRCVVWDLRKNEPIIKLSDSNSRVRWKVVAWHPDVATQLCLASEEDSNPVIQLWDLRFATTPIKTFEGHQKGVLSIAWCSQDAELLVSCGKDSRILCWNPAATQQGDEIVCEMESSNQWNFEVSWCPRNPLLVATSSFDGHASVFSLVGGQQQMQTTNKIADSFPGMEQYAEAPVVQPPQHHTHVHAAELRKAPKWFKRPVGASFAFGGKLVSFGADSQAVVVSQVVTETALLERSRRLQQLLSAEQLAHVCHGRSDPVWSFVAASLEPDARTAMRTLLGFTQEQLELNKYIGQPFKSNHGEVDGLTEDFSVLSSQDVSDEEGKLNSSSGMGSFSIVQNNVDRFNSTGSDDQTSYTSKKLPFKIKIGEEKDGLICRALLAGNLPLAVDLCVKEGRMTDAIILANAAGPDILAATQFKYFQQNESSLSQLVSAVVMGDWSPVASNCDLASWAEALAAMLTYATDDQLPSLCERLGDRLEREGGVDGRRNSEICFVAAGQLGHLIQNRIAADLSTDGLQELVELVLVAGRGDVQSSDTAHLLDRYAQLLAAQGDLDTAITYLAGNQEDIQELRERLYIASGQKVYPTPHAQQKNYYQNAGQTGYATGYGKANPTTAPYHQGTPPSASMFPPSNPGLPSAAPQRKPSISNSLVNNFQNSAPLANSFPPPPPVNSFPPPHSSNFPSASSSFPPQPPPTNIANPASAFAPPAPAPKPFPSSAPPPQRPPTSQTPVQFNQEPAPPLANPGAPPNNFLMRSSPSPSLSGGSRKYVVDPSVGGGGGAYQGSAQYISNPYTPQPTGSYGLPPQPQSAGSLYGLPAQTQPAVPLYGQPAAPQPSLYSQPPAPGLQQPQSAFRGMAVPAFNHPSQQPFSPPPPINTQPERRPQQFVPQMSSAPGWNDPPTLTSGTRNQAKEVYQPPPITHPLFAAAPQQEMPMQPMQGMPPVQQGYSVDEPVYRGGYAPCGPAPPVAPAQVAEPPRPKPPLPEEHMHLQTVLDELRNRCTCAANAPQLRRKLEDVARKLEVLYDAIRDNKVSGQTLSSLHQLVQTAQTGDYPAALHLHTQIASGPDFSQIAAFMPGLKVLVQSALQLGVYLQ